MRLALLVTVCSAPLVVGCPSARLCGGVECTANATCVQQTEGETCRCVGGYVERSGRCQPEGSCGRLATALCRATGNDEQVCGALREGVATAAIVEDVALDFYSSRMYRAGKAFFEYLTGAGRIKADKLVKTASFAVEAPDVPFLPRSEPWDADATQAEGFGGTCD